MRKSFPIILAFLSFIQILSGASSATLKMTPFKSMDERMSIK